MFRFRLCFFCLSLSSIIFITSEKACHINETISANRFSIAQNKNQLNVAKEQLKQHPQTVPHNKILRIFKIVILSLLVMTSIIINAKKAIYHMKLNSRSKKKSIRPSQQYHTVFNATKQQLVQSNKGTKNISLENEKTEYRINGEKSK